MPKIKSFEVPLSVSCMFFLHLEYKQLRIFFIKSRFCGENHSFFLVFDAYGIGHSIESEGGCKEKALYTVL